MRLSLRILREYANKDTVLSCIPQFEQLIGKNSVNTTEAVRSQYSHDEGHFDPKLPDVVLSPRCTEEVSSIVRLCNEYRIPVIPYGTGTGLEGGTIPLYGGVCLNLMEMNQITEVNVEDFDCRVQSGVTRKTLNYHIRDSGLFFPVDPGADASLCGMVATGASGTNAVRYGTMKENVIGLEVVLADGTIVNSRGKGRRPRKSSAGLNLTELFVGSEGIMGVITEACLRLHSRPPALSAAVCSFPILQNAIDAVVQVLQCSIPIARIEFLDDHQIRASNAYSQLDLPVNPTLFLEFHGSTVEEVEAQTKSVGEICSFNSGSDFVFSTERSEMESLWTARHNAYYAALALRKGARGFTTDVCVPISHLVRVVVETRKDMDEHGLLGTIVGHVGDGNFHVILPVYEENEKEMKEVWMFSQRLIERALQAGGTCTGEHGIGIGKMEYLKAEMGIEGLSVMKSLKTAVDPNWIMNPGKVL